jgi:inosine/xanthosine triphosphate pyrophosphatase family protein
MNTTLDGKNIALLATNGFEDSELPGTIADRPRGDNGFGFDTIFINDGYDITRAEMSQEENERTYAEMMKPFAKVRAFVQSLAD